MGRKPRGVGATGILYRRSILPGSGETSGGSEDSRDAALVQSRTSGSVKDCCGTETGGKTTPLPRLNNVSYEVVLLSRCGMAAAGYVMRPSEES